MSHSIAHDCPAPAVIHRLGQRLLLAEWNGPALLSGGRLRVTINGGRARPPFSQITLPRDDGGWRNLLALAAPGSAITKMELSEKDGGLVARFVASTRTSSSDPDFDAHALVLGLDGSKRARLTRFLLEVCGPLFRASSDPVFVANARAVLAEMAPGSGTLSARCTLTPEHLFCEGVVPDTLGERLSAVLLTDDGILRTPAPPALLPTPKAHPGRAGVGLVVPNVARRRGTTIVIFGENGLVCRSLVVARRRLPSATEWFSKDAKQRPQHRRFVLEALARGQCGAAAAPLLRELRVLSGDGERKASTQGPALCATAHLIVDCGDGLFISGELIDPHRVIAGIDVERLGVTRTVDLNSLAFSCSAERVPGSADRRGFAAFVDEPDQAAARAPVRITAGLVSGQRVEVGDGPDLLTPEEAAEAVFASIPPQGASDALLACIEPALQALARQRLAKPKTVEIENIGCVPNRPSLSLIIPFVPEPEVLRCRMGVFAVDPVGDAECLYLVDGAQDRSAAEQLLSDLHAAYGVPCRLVLTERAADAGATLDIARRTARGAHVAFLGRTAVPESGGWLGKLINFLKARPQRGIVSAQALHPDHSLLSAGFAIDPDCDGKWRLRRLLAGFPRDYAPASVASRVDAVSPDCFVLSRGLLHELHGGAGGYLIEASAVAELCFRAAARGFEVWRLPEPAVFRLAAPVRADTEAQAAARLELDRRLLERCWRELRSEGDAEAGQTPSISPSKVVALPATRKVA